MEEKLSNDISESTQQIHFQKFMYTPREGLYQSCSKNCEISDFRKFFFFFFLVR